MDKKQSSKELIKKARELNPKFDLKKLSSTNPADVEVGQIWDLEEFGRVKVLEMEIEDCWTETMDGKRKRVWLHFFSKGEKLKIAGNWKK